MPVFFIILLSFLFFGSVVMYTWYRLHKTMHVYATGGEKTPSDYQLPFQAVSFSSQDMVKLSGWYIPVQNPKAVVILIHGRTLKNGGKSMMLSHAAYLYKNGYSTFLFDMRSIGESEGKVVGFGEKEWQDALAAYQYVQALAENKKVKVGFFGISLGATVALLTAGKEHVGDFVIASVPFATHSSLFGYQVEKENVFPKFLFRWALQLAAQIELGLGYEIFNAQGFVTRIKAPVFLIAAKNDGLVNPKDAWSLYEKANKPKEFWEAKSGHDVYKDVPGEFVDRILRFLSVYAV